MRNADELAAPGSGFAMNTSNCRFATEASTVASTRVVEMNRVCTVVPFTMTLEPATKPVPEMLRDAAFSDGDSSTDLIAGTGFHSVTVASAAEPDTPVDAPTVTELAG